MNFNLFLIIIIALIIILIILYNGIRLFLTVEKEKGVVKYEFKITILKIAIFTRKGTKKIIDTLSPNEDKDSEENEENEEDEKESKGESESEEEEEKGLKEKYEEIKPILKELIKSKEELKNFLKNILKAINLKKLEGKLIIGLSDHTTTVKIASWIWSIGAIVNSSKPTQLSVEPRFNEVITDFEGKIELKINILLLLIYSLALLTKKKIRDLIKELYRQKKSKDKEEKESISDDEEKTDTKNK